MMISHQHKFVFLSYPKAGSTTVGALLRDHADIVGFRIDKTGPYKEFKRHLSAREMKAIFEARGWHWEDYFKFTTVRNPYDRMVSAYHYRKKLMKEPVTGRGRLFNLVWALRGKFGPKLTFRRFLHGYNPGKVHFIPLRNFVCDEQGENLLDSIIRLENLENEMKQLFQQLGLPRNEQPLPRYNPSPDRLDYRAYYTDETRKMIKQYYGWELEQFGYAY